MVLSGAFNWFRCPYIEAHKIGNKEDELETCMTASVTSLASQRHGGTAPMTGALELKVLVFLGKSGSEDKGRA